MAEYPRVRMSEISLRNARVALATSVPRNNEPLTHNEVCRRQVVRPTKFRNGLPSVIFRHHPRGNAPQAVPLLHGQH
jgi:hypothetical protein